MEHAPCDFFHLLPKFMECSSKGHNINYAGGGIDMLGKIHPRYLVIPPSNPPYQISMEIGDPPPPFEGALITRLYKNQYCEPH